jgi:hypothetical protein
VRIVPLIIFDVIVLAAGKLSFFIGIISTKRINDTAMVDSREKSFLMRHSMAQSDLSPNVLEIGVTVPITTHYEPRVRLIDISNCVVGRVVVSVFTTHSPGKIIWLDFFRLLIVCVTAFLYHGLMTASCN